MVQPPRAQVVPSRRLVIRMRRTRLPGEAMARATAREPGTMYALRRRSRHREGASGHASVATDLDGVLSAPLSVDDLECRKDFMVRVVVLDVQDLADRQSAALRRHVTSPRRNDCRGRQNGRTAGNCRRSRALRLCGVDDHTQRGACDQEVGAKDAGVSHVGWSPVPDVGIAFAGGVQGRAAEPLSRKAYAFIRGRRTGWGVGDVCQPFRRSWSRRRACVWRRDSRSRMSRRTTLRTSASAGLRLCAASDGPVPWSMTMRSVPSTVQAALSPDLFATLATSVRTLGLTAQGRRSPAWVAAWDVVWAHVATPECAELVRAEMAMTDATVVAALALGVALSLTPIEPDPLCASDAHVPTARERDAAMAIIEWVITSSPQPVARGEVVHVCLRHIVPAEGHAMPVAAVPMAVRLLRWVLVDADSRVRRLLDIVAQHVDRAWYTALVPELLRVLRYDPDLDIRALVTHVLNLWAYTTPLSDAALPTLWAILGELPTSSVAWRRTAELLGRHDSPAGRARALDLARAVLRPWEAGTSAWCDRLFPLRSDDRNDVLLAPLVPATLRGDPVPVEFCALRTVLQVLPCYHDCDELLPAWLALLPHPDTDIATLAADRILLGGGLLRHPALSTPAVVAALGEELATWSPTKLAETNLLRYTPGYDNPALGRAMQDVMRRDADAAVVGAAQAPTSVLSPILPDLLVARGARVDDLLAHVLRRTPCPVAQHDLPIFFAHADRRVREIGVILSARVTPDRPSSACTAPTDPAV
jgi:hypothetical protein